MPRRVASESAANHFQSELRGLFKWMQPIIVRVIRRSHKQSLARLRRVLEGQIEKSTG